MPIRPENRALYPPFWRVLSGFIRWGRARGQCENPACRALHGFPHPVTGSKVVLTVAHLADPHPGNTRLDNLAALCQRCHLALDRPRHIEARRLRRAKASSAGGPGSGHPGVL